MVPLIWYTIAVAVVACVAVAADADVDVFTGLWFRFYDSCLEA